MVCFHCGRYDHNEGACPERNPGAREDSLGHQGETSACMEIEVGTTNLAEKAGDQNTVFSAWMTAQQSRRRSKTRTSSGDKSVAMANKYPQSQAIIREKSVAKSTGNITNSQPS